MMQEQPSYVPVSGVQVIAVIDQGAVTSVIERLRPGAGYRVLVWSGHELLATRRTDDYGEAVVWAHAFHAHDSPEVWDVDAHV